MADKQGLLGAQTDPSDTSPLVPGRDDREAYEEDWYRSLRAFAERQQHLADQGEEPDEEPSGPELSERGEEPAPLEAIRPGPSPEADQPPVTSFEGSAAEGSFDPSASPSGGPDVPPVEGVVDGAFPSHQPGPTEAAFGQAIDLPAPVEDEALSPNASEPHERIVPPVEPIGADADLDQAESRTFEYDDGVVDGLDAAMPSAPAAEVVVDDVQEPMADEAALGWPEQPPAGAWQGSEAPSGDDPGDEGRPELAPVEEASVEPGSVDAPETEHGWDASADRPDRGVTAAPAVPPSDSRASRLPGGPGPSEEESDRLLGAVTVPLPPGTIGRALSDPDPEVRATAIETLPDVDGAEAIDALTASLSDQDDCVRLTAAQRLASRIEDHEPVWSALRHAPEAVRGDIIASCERVRAGSLTQFALERLWAADQDERALAVEVCGWGASPGCVEGAIHALLDPAAVVRGAATAALGRLRDPAAAKALGMALGDPDPEVRIGVVRALGVIDDEAVLGFLVSALNDPDPRVRDVTSQVLTEWSSPAVARRLAGVLAVPRLREAATDLLTRIGAPAVELLIDVLMQCNSAVVPTVGELLGRIARPDELLSRLDAVEPERRLRGVEALGAIGGPEAADALVRSVADPDERVRARAAQLLPGLGDPRAEDALIGLLRDPIPAVIAAAQEALGRLAAG